MFKLIHNRHGISLHLKENRVNELIIESPAILAELAGELGRQCDGQEGGFVLSEGHRIIGIGKNVVFIKDPFSLDIGGRKFLTKLYQELEGVMENELYEQQAEFHQKYVTYMDAVCDHSEFYLSYNEQPGYQEILKMADIRPDFQVNTLLERIVEFMKIASRLFNQKIFAFLNLKLFLGKGEIEKLYQEVFYRKIHLVLIEAVYQEKLEKEEVCIIDKDQCIIYL